MKKICCIFNVAPHYREAIYREMDKGLNVDFYFGDKMFFPIEKMDYGHLTNFRHELRNVFVRNPVYWQRGSVRLLFKSYSAYLLSGEIWCLSTWLMLIGSRLLGKKVYLWSHGWYGDEGRMKKFVKRMWVNLSAGIFLYGDYAKELARKNGCNERKLHVLYNSLAYDRHLELRKKITDDPLYSVHFKNSNKNLLFTGRLTASKKLDMLLNVIVKLREDHLNPNLVLIGDGPEKTALEHLAKDLGIENQVWFYGACYDEEVLGKLIYNADLCISPGEVGLTAIHSMSFGTPVISHNNFSGQMPEFEAISDGETGCFFEYGDLASLTDSVKRWFGLALNREAVRRKCYDVIDHKYNPHFQMKVMKNQVKI
jgi:glycosyltransferase involved in cell wall biosynthesis